MSTNDTEFLTPLDADGDGAHETDTPTVSAEVQQLRAQASIDAVETIPLPRGRVKAGEAFAITTETLAAWPDQRLDWVFDYNTYRQRWTFTVVHPAHGTLFRGGRATATLGRDYDAYPYLLARFITPTAETVHTPDAITARTLGDPVQLAVVPGPAGGHFPEEAGLTQAEEDALLLRGQSPYPVTHEWV